MFLAWIQMQPSPLNFPTGLKVSNHLILLSWAVLFCSVLFCSVLFCSVLLQIHHFSLLLCLSLFSFLIFSASTVVSEQPPPRPPKPAVLLKSKNYFSSSLQSLHYKSKFPYVLPDGLFPEPFYDSVLDDDNDLKVTGVKKLSLKTPAYLSLRLRPWESTSPSDRLSEVSLIDFGDDSFSSTSPSPIIETPNLIPLKPPMSYAASILDMAPPQSPNRALPNPMHPTPVVDWDMRILPPLPAYDEVAVECAEQEDMEVSSINASVSQEDVVSEQTQSKDGIKIDGKCNVDDTLFLPTKCAEEAHSFSQSADIFKELQREVMVKLRVPPTGRSLPSSPLLTPSALAPHRQIILPSSYDDKPQIPPRIRIPPMRPSKRAGIYGSRLSVSLGDNEDGSRCPPQIPPRDHAISQPNSRAPSPIAPQGSSPQQRSSLCCVGSLGSFLSPSSYSSAPSCSSTMSSTSTATTTSSQYGSTQMAQTPAKSPCILPIVYGGVKASCTHYYLLPEKPAYLDKYDRFLKDSEGNEKKTTNMATVRPMVQQQVNKPNASPSHTSGTSNSLAWPSATQAGAYNRVTLQQVSNSICSHHWLLNDVMVFWDDRLVFL